MAMLVDGFLRTVRYAIRSLVRAPGFTTTVVLTLALGIGGNTAVFSSIDAVLLKPLPFPDANRLVLLRQTQDRSSETNIAPVRLEDWQRLNATFDAITGPLGHDAQVLNRTVRIGNASFPIAGVMARSFLFPDRGVDLWFPVAVDNRFAQSRFATWYTGVGRL